MAGDDPQPEPLSGESRPEEDETASHVREDKVGQWGVLPQKEAEDLSRYGETPYPQKYRDLIEAYFRLEAQKATKHARRQR